jgi:hypothetical protein
MPTLSLVSLVFFLVAVACGAVFATSRGFRAWRTVGRFQRVVGAGMYEVTRGVEDVESRLAHTEDGATGLGDATERLATSLARLRVMTTAVGDVRATILTLAFLRR